MARQVEQVRDHLRKFPGLRAGTYFDIQLALLRQGQTVTIAAIHEAKRTK